MSEIFLATSRISCTAIVSILKSNRLPFFVVIFFSFHQLTPLHRAARRGHQKIVKYLVEKGAGINNEDNEQVCT